MTIQEMHVGVDLGFQAVNLNVWDYFQREEVDYFINKHTVKFIRNRINPKSNVKREGFQENHKRYEELAELITSASLPTYVVSNSDYVVHAILPYDYFTLINDRTRSYYSCNELEWSTPVANNSYYYSWNFLDDTTTIYSDLKVEIKLAAVTVNSFVFANTFSTAINGNIYRPTGLYSLGEKFFIVNTMLYELNVLFPDSPIRVYWEKYDNLYKPNSFIFVNQTANTYTITVTLNGAAIVNAAPINNTVIRTRLDVDKTGTDIVTKPNRLTKTDVYPNFLDHHYLGTKWDSPVSRLQGKRIYVHYNDTFSPDAILIDYIRKPRLCNWYLGVSCELNENFHQEILDTVVQELKALVNSNNYKNIINENLTLE